MSIATNLGFPRIGAKRELKKVLEGYWAGKVSPEDLLAEAKRLRVVHWSLQDTFDIANIPSNDFSLYDHVLDTVAMVGALPKRYRWDGKKVDLDTYFAMARGRADAPAMEMTKWFDTNYHYIVPEFEEGQTFRLVSKKPIEEFNEAKNLGIMTKPVLLGPVSFLLLGKMKDASAAPLTLLHDLLPVYEEVLTRLGASGAEWVQMDEPCLVTDCDAKIQKAFKTAYARLAKAAPKMKLLLATYFEGLGKNIKTACSLPVAALHVDLVRGGDQLEGVLKEIRKPMVLSMGIVDGRNVWKTDLTRATRVLARAADAVGADRIHVAPSCSLMFSPVDLDLETSLDARMRPWFSFAKQKLQELQLLNKALRKGSGKFSEAFEENRKAIEARRKSPLIHDKAVVKQAAGAKPAMARRKSPYAQRKKLQQASLGLPLLPTTTIGSFPQTDQIRAARAAFRKGESSKTDYESFLRGRIRETVRLQEKIGLDALVHGEPERNDMVEYFGQQLKGFAFTQNGWVQSYGSRCVKPPIIFGDVSRPKAMTVEWSRYAQSLTKKPMKGMLTGPVTILQWSFVRDDQPRSATCKQIALAMRHEVHDLDKAGIRMIQIDEPAIREGLPLHRDKFKQYLKWAVECFRLTSCGVRDETQIHTHMCYAEFNDIIEAVGKMDADVLSIEASRSQMELLHAFKTYRYPNDIGPGIYDIHSPRVPESGEMQGLLRKALKVLKPQQLWVNPDCGLKTRRWEEVRPALAAMVDAARALRDQARLSSL